MKANKEKAKEFIEVFLNRTLVSYNKIKLISYCSIYLYLKHLGLLYLLKK